MSKTQAAIVAALAAAIPSCLYIFEAGFDESRYFSKDSIDYYLLVDSEYVKEFPLPKNAAAVVYHSSCGDGPKPPSVAVEVSVNSLETTYVAEINSYLARKHLIKTESKGLFEPSSSRSNQGMLKNDTS